MTYFRKSLRNPTFFQSDTRHSDAGSAVRLWLSQLVSARVSQSAGLPDLAIYSQKAHFGLFFEAESYKILDLAIFRFWATFWATFCAIWL